MPFESLRDKRIGNENINTQGLKMKVIDYIKGDNITIEFEDGYIAYNKTYNNFKNGLIKNPNHPNRVGEEYKLTCGATARIIKYNHSKNVDIKIVETEEIINKVCYADIKKGYIQSKFYPCIYGVGYLGTYESLKDENGKELRSHSTWLSMIKRCYSHSKMYNSYKDCSVCEEWHNYSNFKKWYDENYYEVEEQIMCLDKDILVKGNKIYSPETCIFVPHQINLLFTRKKRQNKDSNLLIGVTKSKNKYSASLHISENNKTKNLFLGNFDNEEDAFYAYKQAKENRIRQKADEYKDKIPEKLYNAMCKWEVEITD